MSDTTDTAINTDDDGDDTILTKELTSTNTKGDDDNVDDYVATLVSAVAKSEITRLKNRSRTDALNPKNEDLNPKKEAIRPFLPMINTDLKPFDYTDEDDTSDLNEAPSTLLDTPLTDTPDVPIQPIPLPLPKTNLRQAMQSSTDSAANNPKDDVTTISKLTPPIPQATYDRPKKGTLTCSNGRRDNSEVIYWWDSPADRSFISPLIPPPSSPVTRPKADLKGTNEGPKYVTFEYDHGGCELYSIV